MHGNRCISGVLLLQGGLLRQPSYGVQGRKVMIPRDGWDGVHYMEFKGSSCQGTAPSEFKIRLLTRTRDLKIIYNSLESHDVPQSPGLLTVNAVDCSLFLITPQHQPPCVTISIELTVFC